VIRTSRYRVTLFAVSLLASFALLSAHASAALDLVLAPAIVVPTKPLSDCFTRAQSALNTVLQNAIKAGDDGVNWLGFEKMAGAGEPSASAVIHCIPVGAGYVATFACSAEVPPNSETADALCTKLTASYGTP